MSIRLRRLRTISREGGMCMKMMGEGACRGLEGFLIEGRMDGWPEGLPMDRYMDGKVDE
jgi:hypothetical protein